jgi:replicative DNA helicase
MPSLTDLLTSRIPPHSLEAERAVLGSILLERESLPRALELLRPPDFYKEGHRKIFEAMIALFERNEPVDSLTLADELKRRSEMEEVGGIAALAGMIDEASTAAHLAAYAAMVRKKALLRELIRVATEVIGMSYEATEDVDRLLDDAERRIFALSERRIHGAPVPARVLLKDTLEHI